jgi:hypothetical protein
MHGSSHHHHKPVKVQKKDSNHFQGGSALDHILQMRSKSIVAVSEGHGVETPLWISVGVNAARDAAAALLAISLVIQQLIPSIDNYMLILLTFSVGWIIWKMGQITWLGWVKLERLHRVLQEEYHEIEENREQEKEELKELYAAKGLTGKLLDDVVDVLMADDKRALKVMLEEELGLILDAYDHPLKQALGVGLGILFAAALAALGLWLWPIYGLMIANMITIIVAAIMTTYYAQNRFIPAICWNLGLCVVTSGVILSLWEAIYLWGHKT